MRNLDPLAIRRRLGRSEWRAPVPFGPDGWAFVHHNDEGSVLATCADLNGDDWIHASIAWRYETPSYDDLKQLHQAVFRDRWAYQVFAPASNHVNIHEYALHLFGRLDGLAVLPDFTEGTGSI